jgi:3-hydroxyisobutyrate dehydrogenase-like beta-hydroxyacid dehydrogenase
MTDILTITAGYPMAKNLRAKIPAEDTLFVQDVNTDASKKFLEEHPQGVQVAANVREVAENAVCILPLSVSAHYPYMMN